MDKRCIVLLDYEKENQLNSSATMVPETTSDLGQVERGLFNRKETLGESNPFTGNTGMNSFNSTILRQSGPIQLA